MGKHSVKVPFSISGRLLEYVVNPKGKIKGIRLVNGDGEHLIKLAKALRYSAPARLEPGTWIQIQGQCKTKLKDGDSTFKAFAITPADPDQDLSQGSRSPAQSSIGSIRVCQKSGCCKRGGKKVWKQLTAALQNTGLSEQVHLKATGCMGKCKAGPNIVVMPQKTRYTQVTSDQVPDLIQQHFAS